MFGYFYAILATQGYYLNQIFRKKLTTKLDAYNAVLLSSTFLTLASLILALILGNFNHIMNYKIFSLIVFNGLTGFLGTYCLFKAFDKLSMSECLTIVNLFPFVFALFSYLVYGNTISIYHFIIMLLVLFGVYLVSKKTLINKQEITKNKFRFDIILLLPVITMFARAVFTFSLNVLTNFNIPSYNTILYLESSILVSNLIYVFFMKVKINTKELVKSRNLIYGFLIGICTTMAGLSFITSLDRANPTISASILSSQIMFVSVFSYFIFKEKLNKTQISGIFIVTIGLILFKVL